jgi:hypothetical protein
VHLKPGHLHLAPPRESPLLSFCMLLKARKKADIMTLKSWKECLQEWM